MRQGDWETLQASGTKLLQEDSLKLSPALQHLLPSILLKSLELLPNQKLARLLSSSFPRTSEKILHMPQDWDDVLDLLANRRWDSIRRFLGAEKRPPLTQLDPERVFLALEAVEELLTDPELPSDLDGCETTNELIGAFIEDFVKQRAFPDARHVDIYSKILQIWTGYRSGSATVPDSQLLLTLAYGVLSCRGDESNEVALAIHLWWKERRIRALVPFVIEGIELLTNYTSDSSLSENLWIEIADLVRIEPEAYSPGEKALLRVLGRRMRLDEETICQFLGFESKDEAEDDILAQTDYKKIAIVSLHEKAASVAAEMIKKRTNVPVVLVTEIVAGPQTKTAKSADVILFVWSASKHAVFRAFDGLRDKIAYVQGVGASSILLSLERWALKHGSLSH